MIKKILMLIVAVVGVSVSARSSDTYVHDASVLPQNAQATITDNFKSTVSVIKIDKDFGQFLNMRLYLSTAPK